MTTRPRAVLAATGTVHLLHDGLADTLYLLLPLWAGEFRLALWQVGALRTAYSGGMSAFQLPAGLLAERWGERWLLAAGTAVAACGYVVAGWMGGFVPLLVLLALAGLGSGVQHPLSATLVSRAYEEGPRRVALGTYNFAGDVGKALVPAAVGLAVAWVGWRSAATALGLAALAAALAIPVALRALAAEPAPRAPTRAPAPRRDGARWGIRDARGFQALAAIGMIDSGTRTGFLTFLPFVLIAKGLSIAGVGGALAVVFAGGACGKFACGLLAERLGIIRTVVLTELATAAGILAVLVVPLPVALALLLPLGVALNGTSSVTYATVADLVAADRRARAYGLFYTLTIGASAAGPTVFGVAADVLGPPTALVVVALVVLATLPLCAVLRPAVAEPARV